MALNAHSESSPTPTWASGRFEVRRLLGKTAATMLWLVHDRRTDVELMLTMPRRAPASSVMLTEWLDRARRIARLEHSNLVPILEIGVHEQWPFVAVERAFGVTLNERIAVQPVRTPTEAAAWLVDGLRGLAFAHDSGIAHGDVQLQHFVINPRGQVRLMALGASVEWLSVGGHGDSAGRAMAMDTAMLREQRGAAERDVLACGVVLHHLLAGSPAFGVVDTAAAMARIAPLGIEILRLPTETPATVTDSLRAVVDRATSPQPPARYRNARTMLGALGSWIVANARESTGPISLMFDRIQSAGHLPALPGLAARVGKIMSLESRRTDEISGQILPDMALTFELLRRLNTAQVQVTQIAGNGPVLTLRRVVELIGIEGVRDAANMLQTWPGALDTEAAARLKRTMDRVRLAGHVAQALRPAGYDAEVVFLLAVMQNMGRLLVRYHFADEAEQIERLMRPEAAAHSLIADRGMAEPTVLTEEAAALSVLGVEIGAFGLAVARRWGIGEDVLQMTRRLSPTAPVGTPVGDAEVLQMVASAANEAVDAVALQPIARLPIALERVVKRYSRVLRVSTRTLNNALQDAREALRKSAAAAPPPSTAAEPTAPAELMD
jgi:serine/threonine protein kinase